MLVDIEARKVSVILSNFLLMASPSLSSSWLISIPELGKGVGGVGVGAGSCPGWVLTPPDWKGIVGGPWTTGFAGTPGWWQPQFMPGGFIMLEGCQLPCCWGSHCPVGPHAGNWGPIGGTEGLHPPHPPHGKTPGWGPRGPPIPWPWGHPWNGGPFHEGCHIAQNVGQLSRTKENFQNSSQERASCITNAISSKGSKPFNIWFRLLTAINFQRISARLCMWMLIHVNELAWKRMNAGHQGTKGEFQHFDRLQTYAFFMKNPSRQAAESRNKRPTESGTLGRNT